MKGLTSIILLALACSVLAQEAEQAPLPENIAVRAASERAYAVYVNGMPGTDITENIQRAVDQVRAGRGGTVVLPPGDYRVTNTIHLAGTPSRFPEGGASGIALIGSGGANGTTLHYRGPENTTVIDASAPWGCTVANLSIDADNIPGVVGIHYHGGYDRQTNGGKNNMFENLTLTRMHIGIWIGDPFGPDLVGSTFRSIWISYMTIGVLVEGGNVTGMAFYNLSVTTWNEAGVKIVGHTARRLRSSPDEEIPSDEVPGYPAVVIDQRTGKELFKKDVPPWAAQRKVFEGTWRGYGPYTWVGGGSPDITIYSLNAHSADPTTWAILTNWGQVRVYSARIEGPAGIFKRAAPGIGGRFNDVLMDVNATSPGGIAGTVIEYHGQGPLFLIGGTYEGNIALGDNTTVYSMGTKFFEWREITSGMVRKDFVIPQGAKVERTGEERIFPGRRGMYDVVNIVIPHDIGFTQLPGTRGAQVHEMTPIATLTAPAEQGATSLTVPLGGMAAQPDDKYQALVTPSFDAGGFWIAAKRTDRIELQFNKPAPAGASFDIVVQRSPFRTQRAIERRFDRD